MNHLTKRKRKKLEKERKTEKRRAETLAFNNRHLLRLERVGGT